MTIGAATSALVQTTSGRDRLNDRTGRPAAGESDSAQPGSVPETPPSRSSGDLTKVNQGGGPRDGFYPKLGNMITSSWILVVPAINSGLVANPYERQRLCVKGIFFVPF
jgi:hypothetical protein